MLALVEKLWEQDQTVPDWYSDTFHRTTQCKNSYRNSWYSSINLKQEFFYDSFPTHKHKAGLKFRLVVAVYHNSPESFNFVFAGAYKSYDCKSRIVYIYSYI